MPEEGGCLSTATGVGLGPGADVAIWGLRLCPPTARIAKVDRKPVGLIIKHAPRS